MAVFTNHIAPLRSIVRDVLVFTSITGPQDRKRLQEDHAGLTSIIANLTDTHTANVRYVIV